MALYGDVTYDSRVMREAETLCSAGHAGHDLLPVRHARGRRSVPRRGARASGILGVARREQSVPAAVESVSRPKARGSRPLDPWLCANPPRVGPLGRRRGWPRRRLARPRPDRLDGGRPTGAVPCRLVYDSHEIFLATGTGARLPRMLRRALSAYEGRLARRAFALVTVNEGYAGVLGSGFRPRRAIIVRNCPPRWVHPSTRRRDSARPRGYQCTSAHPLSRQASPASAASSSSPKPSCGGP